MRRLTPVWLALAIVSILALPAAAAAQEEEEAPPVLRLSFFKCNLNGGAGDRIDTEIEERDIPIWKELVSEGKVMDHGYFFHWWADEWNLGIYTIGTSIPAILEAVEAAAERYEARHGDADTEIAKACPEHRDGFYTIGPSAAGPSTGD
jgi:hypothetical protein